MQINKETVNFITDSFDELTTLYYNYYNNLNLENVSESKDNVIRVSYLEALTNVLNLYMDSEEIEVDDKNQQRVNELVDEIDNLFSTYTVNSEEIRKAMLLLNIKGFKHVNFSLDIITPDAVCLVLVHLVNAIFDQTKQLNIIDPNCGTGNLIAMLNNFLPNEVNFVGIDSHQILTNLFSTQANFMEMAVQVYYQDALQDSFEDFDILVTDVATYEYDIKNYKSHLANKGIKYFPYLLIEKYLSSPNPIQKQIYLIDNDFFEQDGSNEFKNFIKDKAVIKQLIALPNTMFQEENFTRGILVLELLNDENIHQKTGIYMLPSFTETDKLNQVLQEIKKDLK